MIKLFIGFSGLIIFFSCSQIKSSNQNSNGIGSKDSILTSSTTNSPEHPQPAVPATREVFGTDSKINTVFIHQHLEQIQSDSLTVVSGTVFRTGSEPFTKFNIFVSDSDSFVLSGSQAFIDFAEKNQGSVINVSGKIIEKMNQKWIKVYFVYLKK